LREAAKAASALTNTKAGLVFWQAYAGEFAHISRFGALIVMIPSIVAQPLTEMLMYWLHIDMNINSLPVAAIGIGIGIDYGYYILSRIVDEHENCENIDDAIETALMTTGRAILFTGTTPSPQV
jgi:predicted RND superfamily exporter protein